MKTVLKSENLSGDRLVAELVELNAEFHAVIVHASRNAVLERTIQCLSDTLLQTRAYFWYSDSLKRASFEDHERMIELLASGDAEASGRFWKEHLRRGCDRLVEYLRKEEVGSRGSARK